jgi:hypothetical protein
MSRAPDWAEAREIPEKQIFEKEFLVFFYACYFPVLEIVVTIFWMEASVSAQSRCGFHRSSKRTE